MLHCAETVKGGVATYLRELLPLQVAAYGAGAVRVLIPLSQRAELPDCPGVVIKTFDDRGSRVRNAWTLARSARRWVRASAPNVVHLHSTFAGAMVRPLLAVLQARPALVYCPHGWAFDRSMGSLARRLVVLVERCLAWLSEVIVCISEHEMRIALQRGLPAARLQLVRNGVAAKPAPGEGLEPDWVGSGVRLMFVGRFDHQKGLDVLLAAMRELETVAQCAVAGMPVLGDTSVRLPPSVLALGWLSPGQLETAYRSADALVVPSRWEGFGLVAAEAMRAGLAVIASRAGGLPEIVADGQTGLLVEPGSSAALAAAVRSVSRADLQQMGQRGRQRFEQLFTMNRVARELDAVYRRSILMRRGSVPLQMGNFDQPDTGR